MVTLVVVGLVLPDHLEILVVTKASIGSSRIEWHVTTTRMSMVVIGSMHSMRVLPSGLYGLKVLVSDDHGVGGVHINVRLVVHHLDGWLARMGVPEILLLFGMLLLLTIDGNFGRMMRLLLNVTRMDDL